MRRIWGAVLALAVAGSLATGALTHPDEAHAADGIQVPADGMAYFGVALAGQETPSTYVQRTALRPASYGEFAEFPLTSTTKQNLSTAVDAIRAQNGKLFLTLEPHAGLATVTSASAADLATTVAGYNARGVDVFVRFAHEMNGSWYSWSQQPASYIAAFRLVADAVHAAAPQAAMVWAPNYGGGYPYSGGAYTAKAGTADFRTLDTNGNGALSMSDDPYSPYYPGDAYVDWVGLTEYHFGHAWPYGENETPEPGKFSQQLQGTYTGNGRYEDQSALPDFYSNFAVAKGKPMVLAETGALYNEAPAQPGTTEYDIKTAWINQVYGSRSEFPQLKLITWFEVRKYESEAAGIVDWRATSNASIAEVLRSRVLTGSYVFSETSTPSPTPTPTPAAVPPSAPTSLVSSATPNRVVISWKAPASTGGSPVTGYQACRSDSPSSCITVAATTMSATFDQLARKTSYSFTVRALNSAGTGEAAAVTTRTK